MKKLKSLMVSALSLLTLQLLACPVGDRKLSKDELKILKQKLNSSTRSPSAQNALLPTAGSATPWGGSNSSNWKPEAILANAVSDALNTAKNESNLKEVRVAVPVNMIATNNRPYDDGQTNSTLDFHPYWKTPEPQLVATLLTYKNGERKIKFRFSQKTNLQNLEIQLIGFVGTKRFDSSFKLILVNGAFKGEWPVPRDYLFGDLNTSRVLWVKPMGWTDVFPIDFRLTTLSQADLLKASLKKTFGNGSSLLDPLKIKEQTVKTRKSSMEVLLSSQYGEEWDQHNQPPYNPLGIHAEVELVKGKKITTSVGQGWTWVAKKGKAVPFKNLYTCFDSRNFKAESESGTPSGGGWHEIGDAAETIINNLETSPIPVGMATGIPWPTPPDNAKFAWDLKDVAVVGLLQPGEALITGAGDQTWREDTEYRQNHQYSAARGQGNGGGRNYHWFFFPFDKPVCTQEWVHNCLPTVGNGLGLNCK